MDNGQYKFKWVPLESSDAKSDRFAWLHPDTLFAQLPLIQAVTYVEREKLEPILGANNIQFFRNFRSVNVIPTGSSFLLQGTDPVNGQSSIRPFLDIQIAQYPATSEQSQAYVRFPEPSSYQAIAHLLEERLRQQLEQQNMGGIFDKLADQPQPLIFFPKILDSILSSDRFQHVTSLERIKLTFNIRNSQIVIQTTENYHLLTLKTDQISYLILLYVISQYGHYRIYDYPLPEIIQKSLIVLAIQGKTIVPYEYLKSRIHSIFPHTMQDQEEIRIEFLQKETSEESLLIFSSTQMNTRLYPRLKLKDSRVPELLGMLYCFAYPKLKREAKWQKAATIFRFISLYDLFQNEEFKHFQLTRIPLKKLLEVDFDEATRSDLSTLAIDDHMDVHFLNLSEGLNIDLRLIFKSPIASQSAFETHLPTVLVAHRSPYFYTCIELITQLWSASEERLRFLDTTWIHNLVKRLRPGGNYWISYFELKSHLDKLAESPDPSVAALVKKLYAHDSHSPAPYFRYFLGIIGEDLIIAPYPIFPDRRVTKTINPVIGDDNSLRLNIFTSRTPSYLGFCRKVLGLAKDLLDLGAAPGEERMRFNIPRVVHKIESHTLVFIQQYMPPFPEVIEQLQTMLLDMSLYAYQTYNQYLVGYPQTDLLGQLKQRFLQLTPGEQTINILDPIYTLLYTQDAVIRKHLLAWQGLRYPNRQVLTILVQSLHQADKQKQLQLQSNQTERTEALALRLDTLLKSVQAITQYEVQLIAQQPNHILNTPPIQKRIKALINAGENMESECEVILHRLVEEQSFSNNGKEPLSEFG